MNCSEVVVKIVETNHHQGRTDVDWHCSILGDNHISEQAEQDFETRRQSSSSVKPEFESCHSPAIPPSLSELVSKLIEKTIRPTMSELTTAPTSSISRALMASATAMTTASANINGSASLSNGAKAGIVIGASVGVLVLLTLVIWLQIRWSRRMGTKFPDALTPIYPDSFGYIHGYPGPYNTVLHDMSSRDVERAPQSKEQGVRVPKTVRFQETKPHVEEQIAIVSEARDGEAGKDRRNSRTSVLTGSTL